METAVRTQRVGAAAVRRVALCDVEIAIDARSGDLDGATDERDLARPECKSTV